MQDSDRQLFYGDFEHDGEETVRSNVALGRYRVQKERMAKEWLRHQESLREETAKADEKAITRSAKDAAWEAAHAAQDANRIAKIALAVAFIAALIAFAAFVAPLLTGARPN